MGSLSDRPTCPRTRRRPCRSNPRLERCNSSGRSSPRKRCSCTAGRSDSRHNAPTVHKRPRNLHSTWSPLCRSRTADKRHRRSCAARVGGLCPQNLPPLPRPYLSLAGRPATRLSCHRRYSRRSMPEREPHIPEQKRMPDGISTPSGGRLSGHTSSMKHTLHRGYRARTRTSGSGRRTKSGGRHLRQRPWLETIIGKRGLC